MISRAGLLKGIMNYKISDGTLLVAPVLIMFFLPGVGVLIALVCLLLWIADKVSDAQVKEAMKLNPASKIVLHVPVILTAAECDRIINDAVEQANRRVVRLTYCDDEAKGHVFRAIVTRLCQKQGVKVNEAVWKKIGA